VGGDLMITGIKIGDNNSIFYFNSNGLELKRNDFVIVDTLRGIEFGVVVLVPFFSDNKKFDSLDKVIRVASKNDISRYNKNVKDEKEALLNCRNLSLKYSLNMTVVDAHYTFDRNQLIFRFLSDSRVDFRELARHLASIYKTRFELRQIGARDEAREVGGCGQCGRPLCCSSFLKDLDTVSINMAKNQHIALNPSKINGVCGRLMCCLKYEDSSYSFGRKCLPSVGSIVEIAEGKGKVVSIDVLNMKYSVDIDGNVVEVSCGSN
jgi:cell fate regulator YaaT (PSP1 superfamily)